jgi:hypothetical protein
MKTSRVLGVLCAATLAPVALVVPAAHADQSWSGTFSDSDPKAVLQIPDKTTDGCGSPQSVTYKPFAYDTVTYTSTTTGTTTFAMTGDSSGILIVKRNGVCVAGDTSYDNGDDDFTAKRVDVTGVAIAKGDKVEVVMSDVVNRAWGLAITQAGSGNAPAAGAATKYVALPEQVACATGTAIATLTKAAKKAAKKGKIRSIVFAANGQKVAKVKARQVRKAVKNGVVLSGIPKGAVTIDVVVKLRGGKKTGSRPYSAC